MKASSLRSKKQIRKREMPRQQPSGTKKTAYFRITKEAVDLSSKYGNLPTECLKDSEAAEGVSAE